MTEDTKLPAGSMILVTGANGYIASHICNQLLKKGYRVRGTARNPAKSQWLSSRFGEQYGKDRFELVQVEDFTVKGCFDDVMSGCSAVCATAGDFSLQETPAIVVPAAIHSTRNLLTSASSHSSIKRVILTSSSHTVRNYMKNEKLHITPDSWNFENVERAYLPPPYEPTRKFSVYSAVKVKTEQEAWRYVKEDRPSFTLNTIVPNTNLGAIMNAESQTATTARWIEGISNHNWEHFKVIPPQWFVDVEDNALLHVAALTDLSRKNERILAIAEPYNWNTILRILRELRPDHRWPEDLEDNEMPLFTVDNSRGAEMLLRLEGRKWKSLRQSLEETLQSLKL